MNNVPRVVYVVDRYPELSQTFVRDEIVELRRQGVLVDVVAIHRGNQVADVGESVVVLDDTIALPWAMVRFTLQHPIRVMRLAGRILSMGRGYLRLAVKTLPTVALMLGDPNGPRRVHTHFAWGASLVAAYLAALLDVPMSMTAHARDLWVDGEALQSKLAIADPFVTVCEYNLRWLAENGYVATHGVVVPCGVSVPEYASKPDEQARLVSIGRLVPKKGMDVLLEAFALLADKDDQVHLDIVGDGPQRSQLDALIASHDLDGRVTMHGALDHQTALSVLVGAHAFVLACRRDNDGDTDALPVVIREAMACGIPVVSTRIAGIPETVTDDVGRLVDADDPEALAGAMREILDQPALRDQLGLAGRQAVEREWTVARSVARLRDALSLN